MSFDPAFLDELRARVRVSEIAARRVKDLKQKGVEHVGQSPFAENAAQSFTSSDAKGSWYDFSAGRGGDIFDLLIATEGCSHEEAVNVCARIAGLSNEGRGNLAEGHAKAEGVANGGTSNGHADTRSNGGGHPHDTAIHPGHVEGESPPLPEELTNERELLGLILCRPDLLKHAEEEVSPDDFICQDHGRLFVVLLDAREHEYSADVATITAAFTDNPKADVFPGFTAGQYIAHLMVRAPMLADEADVGFVTRNLAREVRRQADLERRIIEPEAEPPAPRKSKYGLVMWSDQDTVGEEYEYLIEDLIPEKEACLIFGETGSGKSFFTIDMALALARGTPFFGKRVLRPLGVVYCAYEGGKGYRHRLRAYRQRHGLLTTDSLPFAVLTKPVDLWSNVLNTDHLIEEIQWVAKTQFNGVPLGAVVIDTHNAATPGASEVEGKDVSTIRDRYHKIMTATGAGVWIVSHKNAAGKHRGNEQLYNNIETAIDISVQTKVVANVVTQLKDAQGRVLRAARIVKQREGEQGILGEFLLGAVETGTNRYGSPKWSCVIQSVEKDDVPQDNPAAEGIKLNDRDHLILRALVDALADGGVNTPLSLKLPQSIKKVIVAKQWTESYRKVAHDLSDDALKQALRRTSDKLIKLRVIGRDNPYIWLTGKPVHGVISAQPKSIIPATEEPSGLD